MLNVEYQIFIVVIFSWNIWYSRFVMTKWWHDDHCYPILNANCSCQADSEAFSVLSYKFLSIFNCRSFLLSCFTKTISKWNSQFQITVCMSSCSAVFAFLIPQILIVNGVCQGKFHSCLFKPCFLIFHQQFASGSTLVIPWHLLPANCQLEMFMEPLIYRFGAAGVPECIGTRGLVSRIFWQIQ